MTATIDEKVESYIVGNVKETIAFLKSCNKRQLIEFALALSERKGDINNNLVKIHGWLE